MADLTAVISTPRGVIRVRLTPEQTPATVANFVNLAKRGYYDGLSFHRVIPDFMIQGGDPLGTGTGGPGYEFADEVSANDKMAPGTLAMANAGPATNGSQFFIVEGTPSHLNGKHTIFGTCKPLDVVGKIARVKRDDDDRPATAVTMKVAISRGAL